MLARIAINSAIWPQNVASYSEISYLSHSEWAILLNWETLHNDDYARLIRSNGSYICTHINNIHCP